MHARASSPRPVRAFILPIASLLSSRFFFVVETPVEIDESCACMGGRTHGHGRVSGMHTGTCTCNGTRVVAWSHDHMVAMSMHMHTHLELELLLERLHVLRQRLDRPRLRPQTHHASRTTPHIERMLMPMPTLMLTLMVMLMPMPVPMPMLLPRLCSPARAALAGSLAGAPRAAADRTP